MLLHDQYLNIAYVRACRAGFEEPAHLFKKGVRIVFGQKTRRIEIERLGAPMVFASANAPAASVGPSLPSVPAERKTTLPSAERRARGKCENSLSTESAIS